MKSLLVLILVAITSQALAQESSNHPTEKIVRAVIQEMQLEVTRRSINQIEINKGLCSSIDSDKILKEFMIESGIYGERRYMDIDDMLVIDFQAKISKKLGCYQEDYKALGGGSLLGDIFNHLDYNRDQRLLEVALIKVLKVKKLSERVYWNPMGQYMSGEDAGVPCQDE